MLHRLHLIRDLAHPDQFRAAMRVTPMTGTLGGAVRCGITVTLSFLVMALAGHADLAGFAALGALASLYGRNEAPAWRWRLMTLAGVSLVATIALGTALTAWGAPTPVLLLAVGAIAALATTACAALRSGPPGGTIIVFAAGAGLAPGGDLPARTVTTLVGVLIGLLVCNADAVVRWARRQPLGSAPRLREVLPDSAALTSGLLVFCASVAAGAIAEVAGWGHPAWAAMGATAVLHGRDVHHIGQRAIQRGLGTLGGALIAVPLLAGRFPFWTVAALVVVLQVVTELVVGRHYGLAMLTITPMALLMTSIGGAADPVTLAVDRGLDTLVGAVIGVAVAVIAARPGASATESGDPAAEAQPTLDPAVTTPGPPASR